MFQLLGSPFFSMATLQASFKYKGDLDKVILLSPFLFLITMEGLNNMIKTTNLRGWLREFHVAREVVERREVAYLQYAMIPSFSVLPRRNNFSA